MPGTFAGRSLFDPLAVYRHCQRVGLPVDWVGLANRYECPTGHESGVGHVLMARGDLDQIDVDTTHDLIFHDNQNRAPIKRLHIAGGTRCLTPGAPLDKQAIHLVPLADHRRIFKLTSINRGYNLHLTPTGAYQAETATDEDTPLDWTEIWEDLWDELPAAYAGAVPLLPATPQGSPDSLAYHGWTVIDAIGDFLDRLGFTLVWNPFADTFNVVQLGIAQAGVADWEAAAMNYRLYDMEPVENQLGTVPGSVEILFRKMPTRAYGNPQFETYIIGDDGSTLPGRQLLRDDLIANFQGGTLTNLSDLGFRAEARSAEFFTARKEWYAKAKHLIYSGIRTDFVPGAELQSVAWSSMGRRGQEAGVLTHVKRMPPRDPIANWLGTPEQPWRLVECVCVFEDGAEEGTSGESPPDGYFDAQVIRWNVDEEEWEFLFLCWVKDVNDQDPPPSGRYQDALFSGFGSGRPIYLIGCCPDEASVCAYDEEAGSSSFDPNTPHTPTPPPPTGIGDCLAVLGGVTEPSVLNVQLLNGTDDGTPGVNSCSCLEGTGTVTQLSEPGPGGALLPDWEGSVSTSCGSAHVEVFCDDNGDGTHTITVNVDCNATNIGSSTAIVASADLNTLDVTLTLTMTDPVWSLGCATCRYQWFAMPMQWVFVSNDCGLGYCACPDEGSLPPGSVDLEEQDFDCVQTATPCCLGTIQVRVTA